MGALRWFGAGPLWIADDGRVLQVLNRATGARTQLDGALRDAVLGGGADDPRLAAMARVDPSARELRAALQAGLPTPLTHADILRGRHYGLLFVELTARCNERCTHCYADAAPERTEALDGATLRAVLDDAAALGFAGVQLTGGDPLLSPHLVAGVEHARRLGIATLEIFTNGLALSSDLLERLVPHAPRFAFSIYSDDPAAHDAVTRVAGSHARTLRALQRCRARGLHVRVGVTTLDGDPGRPAAIRAFLHAQGLDDAALNFTSSRAVGRGHAGGAPLTPLGADGMDGGHGLHAGGGKACVAYTGDVYPCIFARHRRLGSVHERPLRDVLTQRTPVTLDPAALDGHLVAAVERLSCADCRLTDAMLAQPPRRPVAQLPVLT